MSVVLALSSVLLVVGCAQPVKTMAVASVCPPPPKIPSELTNAPRNLCLLTEQEVPVRFRATWQKKCHPPSQ